MGIDLPDIRLIVHFQTPGSLEAYYQEAGRAGRDGDPAHCLLFFGRGDLATQRRLAERSASSAALDARREDALAEMERYATAGACRHDALVRHFTGGEEPEPCGRCDVCTDRVEDEPIAAVERRERAVETLPEDAKAMIVQAVDRLTRPVGRRNLAQALRGGQAKRLARGGLLSMPEYGTLSAFEEDAIVAAIDELLAAGRLARTGQRYPTVWIPGKPVRATVRRKGSDHGTGEEGSAANPRASGGAPRRPSRYGGDIARALDNYRKRKARALGWKPYMVFQRAALLAIDREEPADLEALTRIPGLGPAKLERFGEEILEIVRQHRSRRMD
jgi:ATP-dependent DNA helicase RecQ